MSEKQQEVTESSVFERVDLLSKGEQTALKRSLGKPFYEASSSAWEAFFKAFPNCNPQDEEPYFLAACAYCAFNNVKGPVRSFAKCLKALAEEHEGVRAIFLALLDMPWDKNGFFVRKISRLLRMIRQAEGRPDMDLLLKDLLGWESKKRYVQLRWAREFFYKE